MRVEHHRAARPARCPAEASPLGLIAAINEYSGTCLSESFLLLDKELEFHPFVARGVERKKTGKALTFEELRLEREGGRETGNGGARTLRRKPGVEQLSCRTHARSAKNGGLRRPYKDARTAADLRLGMQCVRRTDEVTVHVLLEPGTRRLGSLNGLVVLHHFDDQIGCLQRHLETTEISFEIEAVCPQGVEPSDRLCVGGRQLCLDTLDYGTPSKLDRAQGMKTTRRRHASSRLEDCVEELGDALVRVDRKKPLAKVSRSTCANSSQHIRFLADWSRPNALDRLGAERLVAREQPPQLAPLSAAGTVHAQRIASSGPQPRTGGTRHRSLE